MPKQETNVLDDLELDPLEGTYGDGIESFNPDSKNKDSEEEQETDTTDTQDTSDNKDEPDKDKKEKSQEEQDKDKEDPDEDKEKDKQEPDEEKEGSDKETGEDDESIIGEIQQRLGYEFEEGEEELPDDVDGITELVKRSAQRMAEQHVDQYFGAFPEMKEMYEYLQYGGEPEKFIETRFPKDDYSKVELDSENEAQQKDVIRAHYQALGYSPEDIKAEITDAENGGILENKAARSLKALQTNQEQSKKSLVEQQKTENQQAQQELEKFWQNIEQTIDNSKEFKGINLSEKEKTPFKNFLTKEVESGKTARDKAVEELDIESNLAIDYLLFKKFDLKGLVERRAKTKNAQSLRDRLKGGRKEEPKNSDGARTRAEAPDVDNLDLPNI